MNGGIEKRRLFNNFGRPYVWNSAMCTGVVKKLGVKTKIGNLRWFVWYLRPNK